MDKLTNLIQEAKPLYHTRKTRKTMTKMLLAICLPVFLCINILQLYLEGSELYVSLDNKNIQNELLQDDFGLLRLNN